MSEKIEKAPKISPFVTRIDAPKKSDFDKYYIEPEYKEVFKKAGVDADGEEYGTIQIKVIEHKIDIAELINSQADSVGVASYMKALSLQGTPIDDFNTVVNDNVQDFSEMPDTLADVMTAGDRAKEAFQKMDPELRGSHTTIEGFLNSLTKDTVDNYLKGKIDKIIPKQEKKDGE